MGVGKAPGKTWGSHRQARKVTMTTLWAAPTRLWHNDNLSCGQFHRYLPRHIQWDGKRNMAKKQYYCTWRQWKWNWLTWAKTLWNIEGNKLNWTELLEPCKCPKTTPNMISDGSFCPALLLKWYIRLASSYSGDLMFSLAAKLCKLDARVVTFCLVRGGLWVWFSLGGLNFFWTFLC